MVFNQLKNRNQFKRGALRFIGSVLVTTVVGVSAHALALTTEDLNSLKPINAEQTVPSSKSQKDKILYFWATWCSDCKSKLTTVFKNKELYEKFDVYLIATDKDNSKIMHYQKKNEIEPHLFTDEERNLQKKLAVFSIPTFVRLKVSEQNLTQVAHQAGGEIQNLLQTEMKGEIK